MTDPATIPPTAQFHPEALRGMALFDAHEYFEAHEALETAWRAESGPVRDLYHGILQVGVAYYHIQRGNYVGARKLFHRSRRWLDRLPAEYGGIDLTQFREDAKRVETTLIRLGPDQTAELDPGLMKPIPWKPAIHGGIPT
ncbi:MAG TPA: DUF309 domain-containing protein [Anaerolineaceae bacterium]